MTRESGDRDGSRPLLPPALARLETILVQACDGSGEWPAQIAAGVYAGVDFVISNPALIETTLAGRVAGGADYEQVVESLAELIRRRAPAARRLSGATDRALVASILGLVGDHVRTGRLDRLAELRPELVLLTLLPYLGFADAQHWADQTAP